MPSIRPAVPQYRAFDTFTQQFGSFKPKEHNLLGSPIAEGPDRTRVELEHRNIDRHGPGWEGARDGVGEEDGWPTDLARYADVVAAG